VRLCLVGGCIDVVRADELLARLDASVLKAKPLVVKTGFDPARRTSTSVTSS
jgi:hypothetical protein